jgi:2-dehydro-3-deoxyphosphooctonate aldolase (KDO 8-P synthase)
MNANPSHHVTIGDLTLGNDRPFTVIAGPCALESRSHALEMSQALAEISGKLGIGLIYKTSYDKANRTSLDGKRGMGLEESLPIFAEVRETTGLPVLTDVHTAEHCAIVAEAVDVLQIPAYLCRQTDLLIAAAKTGRAINVKKGQFLAPWDMTFGYNTLVSDMRSLPIMAADTGCPIIFDATHSVQEPGGKGGSTGGRREFVPVLARAAIAVGVAGVFMETHQDPDRAPSDGPNMIILKDLPDLLETMMEFDRIAKSKPITVEATESAT